MKKLIFIFALFILMISYEKDSNCWICIIKDCDTGITISEEIYCNMSSNEVRSLMDQQIVPGETSAICYNKKWY